MPPALAELLQRLFAYPAVRRAAWLAFVSWVVALTATGYLFGFGEGFFGRLFSATLVLWLLAAGSVLGIRPLIGWLTHQLSGGNGRPRTPRAAAPKRPVTRRPGSAPTSVPASKWR